MGHVLVLTAPLNYRPDMESVSHTEPEEFSDFFIIDILYNSWINYRVCMFIFYKTSICVFINDLFLLYLYGSN